MLRDDSFDDPSKHKLYVTDVLLLFNEPHEIMGIAVDTETAAKPDPTLSAKENQRLSTRDRAHCTQLCGIIIFKNGTLTPFMLHIAKYRNNPDMAKLYKKVVLAMFNAAKSDVNLYAYNMSFDARVLYNFGFFMDDYMKEQDFGAVDISTPSKKTRKTFLDALETLKCVKTERGKLGDVLEELGYHGKDLNGADAVQLALKNTPESLKTLAIYCMWDAVAVVLVMIEDGWLREDYKHTVASQLVRCFQDFPFSEQLKRGLEHKGLYVNDTPEGGKKLLFDVYDACSAQGGAPVPSLEPVASVDPDDYLKGSSPSERSPSERSRSTSPVLGWWNRKRKRDDDGVEFVKVEHVNDPVASFDLTQESDSDEEAAYESGSMAAAKANARPAAAAASNSDEESDINTDEEPAEAFKRRQRRRREAELQKCNES